MPNPPEIIEYMTPLTPKMMSSKHTRVSGRDHVHMWSYLGNHCHTNLVRMEQEPALDLADSSKLQGRSGNDRKVVKHLHLR